MNPTTPGVRPYKALVTGGGGFLGGAIVGQLLERGYRVRSFARGAYPELEARGVEVIRGDLANREAVRGACAGSDVVFHAAAKAGIWGAYRDYYETNVVGTENVILACRDCGIRNLVYTSSPSVVFDGTDMEGVDESVPYPRNYHAHYPRTKALAEQRVRAADSPGLGTVCLRPHLIWGPGDNHILPRLAARARAGRLRRIGKVDKLVDTTYVDDGARAHLLAAHRLMSGAPIGGKVYFISQGEPRLLWELIGQFLEAAGAPPVTKTIPTRIARAAGETLEFLYTFLPMQSEPPMTRFLADELSTAHYFDISAARRDLGYEPSITIDEGLRRLREWFRRMEEKVSKKRCQDDFTGV